MFTETINNSGFGDGMFWFYVLPLGFLLTMYTQTGYDASAHISEETHGARQGGRQGRLARGLLVGRRSAGSCCWRSRSRPTDVARHQRRRRLARWRSSPRALPRRLAEGRRADRHHRPAVLRHGLRDQRARA